MNVRELMTQDPVCCTPETSLQDVAKMMVANDCGEIPVIQAAQGRKLVGVITDRDIVCRAVAEGKGSTTKVENCMTRDIVTVTPETSLEDCRLLMEENQIRRVPVVDANNVCCGIVSQADIAVRASTGETGELVREVSRH